MADYDLNRAIASWRADLADTGDLLPADLDELELHLRDTIDGLQADSNLGDEPAFESARARLGPIEEIGLEYRKVQPWASWRAPLFWILSGCVIWSLLPLWWNAAVSVILWLDLRVGLGAVPLQAAVILATLTVPVLGVAGGRWLLRRTPTVHRSSSSLNLALLGTAAALLLIYGNRVVSSALGLFIHEQSVDHATFSLHDNALETAYGTATVVLILCLTVAALVLRRRTSRAPLSRQPVCWLLVSYFLWSGATASAQLGSQLLVICSSQIGVGLASLSLLMFIAGVAVPLIAVMSIRAIVLRFPVQAVSRRATAAALFIAASLTMVQLATAEQMSGGAMAACGGGIQLDKVMLASHRACTIALVALVTATSIRLWPRHGAAGRRLG